MNSKIVFFIKNKNYIILILIFYSILCFLNTGNSWDLRDHFLSGKSTFEYLFSLGKINNHFNLREYNSASYWTFSYFLTQFFPKAYDLKIFNLVNLIFGWLGLIGFYKLGKILFNKNIGIIFFLTLFFQPIYFGHMSINPKDIILAMSHLWIFYFVVFYLKKQNDDFNSQKIIYKISSLLAIATGIQLYFIVTLLPIIIFVFLEIFLLKKIQNKFFNKKKFIKDVLIIFILFYSFLIFFWIDAHQNIIFKPIELFLSALDAPRGWPGNMLNGKIFFSWEAPKYYLIYLLLIKSPEYILSLYIVFFVFIYKIIVFFKKKFRFFLPKLYLLITLAFFPHFLSIVSPFPLYDGVRLFIWSIPYTLIIPSLSIYYLIYNKNIILKFCKNFILTLFVYYLIIFFSYTPYQYTYLNFLSGSPKNKNTKFENDYWGVTLSELMHKIKKKPFANNSKNLKVFFCGVPIKILKEEIKKNQIINFYSTDIRESEYIILTNRVFAIDDKKNKKIVIKKCLDLVEEPIVTVKRFGHTLSIFGKIKNNSF